MKKEARQLSVMVAEWTRDLFKVEGVTVGSKALTVAREHRFDERIKAAKEAPGWMVTTADEINPTQAAQHVSGVLERSRGFWGEHHTDAETRRLLGSRFRDVCLWPQSACRNVSVQSLRRSRNARWQAYGTRYRKAGGDGIFYICQTDSRAIFTRAEAIRILTTRRAR